MRPVILGTAGHIDHGKTTLVRALTGTNTDRLPEEKARGITIELGFAYLDAGGRRFGIVDVPGHERFVRTMVAGAGGIDVVALVIAAEEGVMPQTREHLDVCGLLGVQRGVIVLTKSDLVDEEWLELVSEDVREVVAGTFLEEAPIVRFAVPPDGPVVGQDELVAALVDIASTIDDRPSAGALRLPVDRVFTIKGFGTVITGTLISGRISSGETVELLPSRRRAKVRGLQVHAETVEHAEAGQRTAINLQGVDREEISRGDVVVLAGTLGTTTMFDAEVRYLEHIDRPLKHRARLLLHIGAATARATVAFVDRDELEPGSTAFAQLRLDRSVAVLPGDTFILRGFTKTETHGRTVGGGTVVANLPRKHRKKDPQALERMRAMHEAPADRYIELLLQGAGAAGLDHAERLARTGYPRKVEDEAVRVLLGSGRALRFDKDRGAVAAMSVVDGLLEKSIEIATRFHDDNPRRRGVPIEELRSRLGDAVDPRLFHVLLTRLHKSGKATADRDIVTLVGFEPRDDAALEAAKAAVLQLYVDEGTTPPRARDLPDRLGQPAERVEGAIHELTEAGDLVRIHEDIYVARVALDDLRVRLVAHLEEHDQIDAGGFKKLVGGSRKFAIPLAEHFDKERLTMRVGDGRVLRRR